MHVVSVYLLFWLVLMGLAVANGVLREFTYGQYWSELRAHQFSTLAGVVVFGLAVRLLSKRRSPDSAVQAAGIGAVWLTLTLCFEFLFGHYIAGHTWARLLQDYDVLSGRVWPLFLVWITVLPYLAYKTRKLAT